MSLVPNWRKLHKAWSVQVVALSTVADMLWSNLPALQEVIPPKMFFALCGVCFLAFLAARLTHQPELHDDD